MLKIKNNKLPCKKENEAMVQVKTYFNYNYGLLKSDVISYEEFENDFIGESKESNNE